MISNEIVDLTRDEADLALRFVRPKKGNLLVQKLGVQRSGIFGNATSISLKKNDYQWIVWGPFETWIRKQIQNPKIILRTNSINATITALQSGRGSPFWTVV